MSTQNGSFAKNSSWRFTYSISKSLINLKNNSHEMQSKWFDGNFPVLYTGGQYEYLVDNSLTESWRDSNLDDIWWSSSRSIF